MIAPSNRYGLYLDIQTIQHLAYIRRGIPRFVGGLAEALLRRPGLVRGLGLNPTRPFPQPLDDSLLSSPLLNWCTIKSFRQAQAQGPLAYFLMSPFELGPPVETMLPPFAMGPETPLIVTLYDLIPLLRPSYYLRDRDIARRYRIRLESIRQADLVLTISEHTRRDAIARLHLDPDRLRTIGAGVSSFFRPQGPDEDSSQELKSALPQVRKPFLVTLSGAEERKNTEGLIAAFALLPKSVREGFQLVIVCKLNPEYLDKWTAVAKRNGLSTRDVIFTDLISDRTLRTLYRRAELSVFPSFYEGFGLPPAEAAACGCPTITSNTSSMPEVLRFAPAMFDPHDIADMARAMERGLTDEVFKRDLRLAAEAIRGEHTWEKVATRTIEALKSLPEPRRGRRPIPATRLRVALAGPFPPLKSGIADYNIRLAAELAPLVQLDLLVSCGKVDHTLAESLPGVRCFPIRALGKNLNPFGYDCIIYVLGNNEHHHITYEMALRYPGIVWLHDIQLSGLLISYANDRYSDSDAKIFLTEKLQSMYRERLPIELLEEPRASIRQFAEFNMGLTGEVVSAAKGVVVSSHVARTLLELDLDPFSAWPPRKVIPLAVPRRKARRDAESGKDPIIGSFGIGSWHKAPDLLIESLAILRETIPARVVFVGAMDQSGLQASLEEHAARAGVLPWIEFTGAVDDDEYDLWLGRVVCAVQLRRGTTGESSAAVNDCLGAGVPVVTNLASCGEMRPGTVELITSGLSAATVAQKAARLIADEPHRHSVADAGLRYARERTFKTSALEVVDFVRSVSLDSIERPTAATTSASS